MYICKRKYILSAMHCDFKVAISLSSHLIIIREKKYTISMQVREMKYCNVGFLGLKARYSPTQGAVLKGQSLENK